MDNSLIKQAFMCKCPRCHEGDLYQSRWSMVLHEKCASCDLDLARNDSADGPAVFLIFVLGFLLVPMALFFEALFSPPLWVHAALWSAVALGLTVSSLRPLKAYIMALQLKHRPESWE